MSIWSDLIAQGRIEGEAAYYESGDATPDEYAHALRVAWDAIQEAGDETEKAEFWSGLVESGAIAGNPAYYSDQEAQPAEFENAFNVAAEAFDTNPQIGDTGAQATGPGPQPGALPGTQQFGDQTLPTGMRLVRVTGPAGSDATSLYYAVGTVFGVDVGYEIGDETRLNALFGGVAYFGDVATQSQAQYDASGVLTVGSIDEQLGATGSLQAQYERDLRSLGMESPPAWMVADQTAMATFVTGVNEGWSAERTWQALSGLDSFKNRFAGLSTIQAQLGTGSYGDSIAEYLSREASIRNSLRRFRGPQTDITESYVGSLIGSGWDPAEVSELLELEREVVDSPEALANINEILAYSDGQVLTPGDFIDFLRDGKYVGTEGYTPGDTFEAVNDALRQTALQRAGLDVSTELAASLGDGSSFSIESPDRFNDEAQYVAGVVAANRNALDLGAYGLDETSVIQFFLGESDDPDVGRKLERLGRERNIAAKGFAGSTTFIGAEGRLRVQGFSDL